MNNFPLKYTVAIVFMILIFSCKSKRENIDTSGNTTPEIEKIVTIYGSENCDHCLDFRKKMDSAKFKYEFKDAEANEKYYQELLLKIQQANFKGYVSFPVIDINGEIYVRPEFSDIQKIISD